MIEALFLRLSSRSLAFRRGHGRRSRVAEGAFQVAALGLCFSLSVLMSSSTHAHSDEHARKKAFGPFDAGATRAVKRQGKKGISRAAHPMLGNVAKVPGEGPPPPPLRRDADIPEDAIRTANRMGSSLSSNPLWLFALTYRHLVTRIDGPKCGHYPTCSHLANQAVARYGPLGIFIGLDRIIQPPLSSSLRPHPQVVFPELTRAFDPLSNYEFWKPSFSPFPAKTDESPLEFGGNADDVQDAAAPHESDSTSTSSQTNAQAPSAPHPVKSPVKESNGQEDAFLDDGDLHSLKKIRSHPKRKAS